MIVVVPSERWIGKASQSPDGLLLFLPNGSKQQTRMWTSHGCYDLVEQWSGVKYDYLVAVDSIRLDWTDGNIGFLSPL